MLMTRLLSATLLALLLSACALKPAPFVAYDDANRPLAQTSVFTTHSEQELGTVTIEAVNGRPTKGNPALFANLVARVVPGKNVFLLQFRNTDTTSWMTKYTKEPIELVVDDMKPKHIYLVRRRVVDLTIQFYVDDLGVKPNYSLPVGLPGVNYERYRPEFE